MFAREVVAPLAMIAATLAVALPARARADADDLVGRPVVLASGELDAQLGLARDQTTEETTRPLTLSPDAWFGVSDRLTVGVFHSYTSLERYEPEASFCLVTADSRTLGCQHFYHGSGVDARWGIPLRGLDHWSFAPRARLYALDTSPLKPALALGAIARWHHGRFAVTMDPYVRLGLYNTSSGNRAGLVLPVELAIQPTCRWALELWTGVNGDFASFTDAYRVPIVAMTELRLPAGVELGGGFGFHSLLGPLNTAKDRTLFVSIGWRGRVID